MNRCSEEQAGKEKSGSGRRCVAGIIVQRRLRGGEVVRGMQGKDSGGQKRAGRVRHDFNFLNSENKCFL